MFINAVYTCQMIGPCIFTDYTLDVGYWLDICDRACENEPSERKLHLVR